MDESQGPLERIDFASSDPGETRDFLEESYGWRMRLQRSQEPGRNLTVSMVDLGSLVTARAVAPGELSYDVTGADYVVVDTLLEGEFELAHRDGLHRYGRGDVFIANQPGAEFASTTRDIRVLTATLPCWLLEEVANPDPDGDPEPVRFTSYAPITGDSRYWREVSRLVEQLVGGISGVQGSLVVGALARQLASAALVTFANGAVTEPTWRDEHDGHPAALRRAMAFIDANPDIDIALSDIARAARTSPAAVTIAFARHLDTSPLEYLRRVRLDRAHSDLIQAPQVDATLIAEVAGRWGYQEVDRFVHDFRFEYGRSPEF